MNLPVTQPTFNRQLTLRQFVDGIRLTPEDSDLLNNVLVEKVKVYPVSCFWELHLRFPCLYRDWDEVWSSLAEHFKARVPALKKVKYVDYYRCESDLSLFVGQYETLFLKKVMNKIPAGAGWLSAARLAVKEGRLVLRLPNSLGVQFMLDKGMDRVFSGILQEYFGLKAGFIFTVDESLHSGISIEPGRVLVPKSLEQHKPVRKQVKQGEQQENAPLMGKLIKNEITPIAAVQDEEKSIVIRGQVVNLEARELRSGRVLYMWDITDGSDTITVKVFSDEKNQESLATIGKGLWLLVQGPVQHDRYTQELTLMARDINKALPVLREDHAHDKRVELHLHTKMSALDGMVDVEEAIKTAARWGHPAIAITDHGVVQAFPEAAEVGHKLGMKIIYGVEGYLYEGTRQKENYYHIVILAKNQQGLQNLYRLITISHLEHFYRKPRIPRQALAELREGLLLGTACEAGELIQAYLKGASWEELCRIADFYDYIEIQPTGNNEFLLHKGTVSSLNDLQEMNRKLWELGKQLGKPVVATGDVHFLNPEDAVYRRILQAGQNYEDTGQAPLFLRTTAEMLAEFDYLGEDTARQVVIQNPNLIAQQIETVTPLPEGLFAPEIPGAEEQVAAMCRSQARKMYGEPLPEIVEARLNRELDSIISNGYAVLYLIAHKLVKKSNEDGYLVGSRGSVGSSLVATFCGITEVNPLPPHYLCSHCRYSEFITDGSFNSGADLPDKTCPKCGSSLAKGGHDIPFETFLGFKGDKVPDIDLNFSGEYQAQAHKYTETLFGKDYVFRAGTIATIAEKTAFGFVKKYLEQTNTVKRNAEVGRLVKGCTGVKRTTGQHPGGLMVVPKSLDIHRFTPLQRPADDPKSGTVTTHFDYHSISDRLVKLDILGHDDPTVIKMLEDLTGVDAKTIPLDDKATLSLFSGVEALGVTAEEIRSPVGTYGIPEFGTRFVRQMLVDTKPQKFSDLVRISGFSHGTDVWLNNAQELIKSQTAKLSEAISTRDDIMIYLMYKNMPPATAFKIMEDVRKGKGVKPEYEEEMRQHGVPDWYIASCKKIKYMFPKAHAVAYVTMAFRIAYFKINYPLAFYASFFTVRADEFDAQLIVRGREAVLKAIEDIEGKGNDASAKEKSLLAILEVALEMMARGYGFTKVDLIKSDAAKFMITDQGLLPPLASLQGIGKAAAQNIVEARNERPFTSVEDLKYRGKASKTVIEVLEAHGSLEGLAPTDQLSLF